MHSQVECRGETHIRANTIPCQSLAKLRENAAILGKHSERQRVPHSSIVIAITPRKYSRQPIVIDTTRDCFESDLRLFSNSFL